MTTPIRSAASLRRLATVCAAAAALLMAAASSAAPTAPPAKGKGSADLDSLMNNSTDKPKQGKGNKDIDSMLKEVQKPDSKPVPKKEPEREDLPQLSQTDIKTAMDQVKTKAHDCAVSTKSKGLAELKITVGKDGKVSSVGVGGKVAGTPLATCIEKITKEAKFPASKGLTFDYRLDAR